MTDRFAVWQFFPNDWHECIGEQLTAAEAVPLAKQLTESLGGRLGTTQRVIIVDDEDCTVFEWRHGEGVTFPPREPPA